MIDAAWTVLHHAEHEEFARARRCLPANAKAMSIPALGPVLRVLINRMKKEVMDEPYVGGAVGVEARGLPGSQLMQEWAEMARWFALNKNERFLGGCPLSMHQYTDPSKSTKKFARTSWYQTAMGI